MPRCQFDKRKDELCENLRMLWNTRELADNTDGAAWYPKAQAIVSEWAQSFGIQRETVACVVAALSPQIDWERNLIIADDILHGLPPSIRGLQSNVTKAQRILADGATDTLLYFPQGPKVASFARNLWGDMSFVTVDTHCIQAALNDAASTVTLRWTPYTVFAECYATVARELDLQPATFQSIIWHTWKRLYPRMRKHALRKRW